MENTTFELILDWEVVNTVDSDRVDAMYCFTHCSVNNN